MAFFKTGDSEVISVNDTPEEIIVKPANEAVGEETIDLLEKNDEVVNNDK